MPHPVHPNTRANILKYNEALREGRAQPADRNNVGLARRVAGITRAQPASVHLAAEILAILDGENLGHIRPADRVAVELLAVTLRKIHQCEAILDERGLVGKGGAVRPIAGLLVQLLREARGYAVTLGMTPAARAKLGLDLGRATGEALALARALRSMGVLGPDGLPEDAPNGRTRGGEDDG